MRVSFPNTLNEEQDVLLIPVAGAAMLDAVLAKLATESAISPQLIKADFEGKKGDIQIIYQNNTRIFLVGLGETPDLSTIVRCFRRLSYKSKEHLPSCLGISLLHNNQPEDIEIWLEAIVNGLLLGSYQIGQFKTEQEAAHPIAAESAELQLYIPSALVEIGQKAAFRGQAFAETQMSIFKLVNAPSNKKQPIHLAAWAENSGKEYGYKVTVLHKEAITELGLHALLAVNRGSEYPATFTIMEYCPQGHSADTLPSIGIVGKGVTFDSGGVSIKPSTNMHLMKSDMGGAAAVFGTMEMAAKLQLPIHLYGIVPATDNSVDANAIKPSDVIDSYSGKTIEIIDTDAEGRLILADGIAYMLKHFAPETLIDVATLTGSAVRTFGYHAAGLFSNDDQLVEQLYAAGEQSGEKLWRLPIWDVYKEDIKSDVADVRNFSGRPMAGAIGAAKFLEFFTANHPRWAHLDIAGVAFSEMEFSNQKSATGFGVRLFVEFLSNLGQQ